MLGHLDYTNAHRHPAAAAVTTLYYIPLRSRSADNIILCRCAAWQMYYSRNGTSSYITYYSYAYIRIHPFVPRHTVDRPCAVEIIISRERSIVHRSPSSSVGSVEQK